MQMTRKSNFSHTKGADWTGIHLKVQIPDLPRGAVHSAKRLQGHHRPCYRATVLWGGNAGETSKWEDDESLANAANQSPDCISHFFGMSGLALPAPPRWSLASQSSKLGDVSHVGAPVLP